MQRSLLFSLVLLSLFASGCGLIDSAFLPEPEETAQELYDSGRVAMAEGEYKKAAKNFTTLKDRYPFSPYVIQAELGLADSLYLNGKYKEAADAYAEFESLHPSDENIPYVLYQMGKANFESFEAIDRPMGSIEDAQAAFVRVRDSFPESQYAEPAAEYIDKCRRRMAEHELFVADFYWKSGRYGSAWKRYDYVAETFKDMPDVVGYAEKRSRLAYYEFQKDFAEERRKDDHGGIWSWLEDWL